MKYAKTATIHASIRSVIKTMIISIIIKTMIISIKSPDDEDAKDGEPKSDASPQGLKMGTGASA